VKKGEDGTPDLIYIDLHLVHEVTSPQAFDGLRWPAARCAPRPHDRDRGPQHPDARDRPAHRRPDEPHADRDPPPQREEFGIRLHSLGDIEQGIVHVVGPQLGLTQPASPSSAATRTRRPRRVRRHGVRHRHERGRARARDADAAAEAVQDHGDQRRGHAAPGVTAKDIILAVIAKIGTGGGQGYVLEYRGSAIRAPLDGRRMTICNMSIEAGARAGMVAPMRRPIAYLEGPRARARRAPTGTTPSLLETLATDEGAEFDAEVFIDADALEPFVTWGTNPARASR
jgi:3-isopropylmalate/(R)-2-methylmalate dehydratase large subunit